MMGMRDMQKRGVQRRDMKKGRNKAGLARLAAAAGLMGLCFLCGGVRADAGYMKAVFDEQYYADRYPDLKELYGYDREALWEHYAGHGMDEGRLMNEIIDVVAYRNTYPDLDEVFGDDWDAYVEHYLMTGAEEGRQAGGRFDEREYEEIREELQILQEECRNAVLSEQPVEPEPELPPEFWEQAIGEGSYGALWGLEQVDKPVLREFEGILQKLGELAQGNELIAQICAGYFYFPEHMLQNLANNPEMADFVLGYRGVTDSAAGGLTEEELALKYPLFLQWDPRWGYVTYGYNSCIGLAGCGPACVSMALYYLTGNASLTPDVIAAYSMAKGYYVPGAGTAWKLLSDAPAAFGIKVSEPLWSEQVLKSALDQGQIILLSMRAGNFTAGGHFILIYGYDEEGFMVNDPNCVARSRRQWTYAELAPDIRHVWLLEGEAAPATAEAPAVPAVQ